LELKEESENGRLFPVKEKRSFKRFDLLATLAALGVLAILLFEGVFVFELYRVEFSTIEPYLPAAAKPSVERWLSPPPPEEPVPVPAEAEKLPVEDEESALVEVLTTNDVPVPEETPIVPVPVETNTVPVEAEDSAPVG
jgi:hypothetical protein